MCGCDARHCGGVGCVVAVCIYFYVVVAGCVVVVDDVDVAVYISGSVAMNDSIMCGVVIELW